MASLLHTISQALLIPVIVLLIAFIGYALFCIGSIIVEAVNERRNFKVEMPKFLTALMDSEDEKIPGVIKSSGLLNRQKTALLTAYDYRTLPGDAYVALIRRLVNAEEEHYAHITERNNTAAKIAPMAGLMGTLIPLGPGVAALGTGDTETLSNSLLIAFDTTVAGLVVAVVCLAVGKIRTSWYNDYMQALDSAMATLVEKVGQMREAGKITIKEPSSYAFMFQEGLKKGAGAKKDQPKDMNLPTGQAAGAAQPGRPQVQPGQQPAAGASARPQAAGVPAGAQAQPGQQVAGAQAAGRGFAQPGQTQQLQQPGQQRPAQAAQARPAQAAQAAQAQQPANAAFAPAGQAAQGATQAAQQYQSQFAAPQTLTDRVAQAGQGAASQASQAATAAAAQVAGAAQAARSGAAQAADQAAAQAQRAGWPPADQGGRRG